MPDAETARLDEILPRRTRRYWRETVPGLRIVTKFSA